MHSQRTELGLRQSFFSTASILAALVAACGGSTIESRGTPDEAGGGVPNPSGGAAGSGSAAKATGGSALGEAGAGGVVRSSGGFVSTGGGVSGVGGVIQSGGTATGTGARDAGDVRDAGDGSAPIADPCGFSLSVTTVSYNGRFAPRNVGAIWIEDATGSFVKTLHTWGGPRLNNAVRWNSVAAGSRVDAISSATRAGHGPVSGAWNCTDDSRSAVPQGPYSACIEFEEDVIAFTGAAPHYACEPFFLGTPATTGTWPDQTLFVEMSWAFEPKDAAP